MGVVQDQAHAKDLDQVLGEVVREKEYPHEGGPSKELRAEQRGQELR